MNKKSLLLGWTKYNHSILRGILPERDEAKNFVKITSDLSNLNISSVNIIGYSDNCYIVEYNEGETKNSMKVYFTDLM